MGHKVHPVGFRLGIIRDWQAKWFAARPSNYKALLAEDLKVRDIIHKRHGAGDISRVEIERSAKDLTVSIHTARPGIIIGRAGQRVEELRKALEAATAKRVKLNIVEVRHPELDAYLVARNIADQIERRISFRRAMKQTVSRSMAAGAKGVRVLCSGRLAGAEIARSAKEHEGQVPLHTLRADIDFGIAEARTPLGRIGVKVWINRGLVMPEPKRVETVAAAAPAAAAGETKKSDAPA
ncbi:MAG: 30S ribosomal protein S3 [Chloroflexi bacterium]|nr:30S ribosomal protein S3 [Chloroflexota bacterium]